jgi:hypothetical protein
MGMALGFLKKKTPLSELMERRFIPAPVSPVSIDMSRLDSVRKPETPTP